MDARTPAWFGLIAANLLVPAQAALEAPTHPSRDTVVETRLLPSAVKQDVRALVAPPRHPAPERVAARVRALLEAGRVSGDPRMLGYAQATLGSAAQAPSAPLELRVLQASLAQSRHEFDAARTQLDAVLREDPEHPQALVISVAVALVQGRTQDAASHCQTLAHVDAFLQGICQAQVAAATGQLDTARSLLQGLASAGPPPLRGWAYSLLGESELRAGHYAAAEDALQRALALGEDHYTRVLLADVLIAARRPEAARRALAQAAPTDAVLLRRALAEAHDAVGREAIVELQRRIEEAATRGDRSHAREQAWFALDLAHQPAAALALAQANWAVQREPVDAWLLARAAAANQDLAQLRAVRAWATQSGVRDARLMEVLGHVVRS